MNNLLGTDYVLYIDTETALTAERGTEANYRVVACLNTNGVTVSIADQDVSNKCDGGFKNSVPGILSWNFSGDGIAASITEAEEATFANYQELLALAKGRTQFFAKISNATETIIREGKVYISEYSETQPNAAAYTFTANFIGLGELFIVPAA